jgi:hypothetical protein
VDRRVSAAADAAGQPSTSRHATATTHVTPTVTVTIDVHESDTPRAVDTCSAALAERGVTATFFVPSALFHHDRLGPAVRRLGETTHAIGSHGHLHDQSEILALRGRDGLGFLTESRDRFAQFYGYAPRFFRSPCWCELSDAAFVTLARLGYRVDCSSTPSRPGLLSSEPLANPWLSSPRKPYFVCGSLLEVPTSCLLLPLGSPTFLVLRTRASIAFCRLLLWEATVRPEIVVNVMLHTADFLDDWGYGRLPFSLSDLLPQRDGGLTWRRFLRMSDPRRISSCVGAVVGSLGPVTTLEDVYERYAAPDHRTNGGVRLHARRS